jgi:hypothetical protein
MHISEATTSVTWFITFFQRQSGFRPWRLIV